MDCDPLELTQRLPTPREQALETALRDLRTAVHHYMNPWQAGVTPAEARIELGRAYTHAREVAP